MQWIPCQRGCVELVELAVLSELQLITVEMMNNQLAACTSAGPV
jgi:hypothetical protein